MARKTTTVKPKARSARPAAGAPRAKKWVYLYFEPKEVAAAEKYVGGAWDNVRALLGGKGANLAEMTASSCRSPRALRSRPRPATLI